MDEKTVYEIGMLLMPTLGDEAAVESFSSLKKFILSLDGQEVAEGAPERIDLAYTMTKVIENKNIRFNEAYFCWYKFFLAAEDIAKVKEHLTKHAHIIRHLIFKTVEENTFIPRRSKRRVREEGEAEDLDAIIDNPEVAAQPVVTEEAVALEEPTESEILDNKIESLIPDSE